MEELDLYDDLDEFQEQQEKKTKELQELEIKYQESLKTIEDLQKENKTLKKNIKTIELNFQSLLDTARAEIRRKNKEIDQLRKEKDDIVFRRKPSHKVESHKRHLPADVVSTENPAQTFKKQDLQHPESKETFIPQGYETHEDKADNISKPVRDESFKRNRSQEGDPDLTNDNKRLKNSRDDRANKYSHERHKDYHTDAYKKSSQNDERYHSHDSRKYESAERNQKTKSPERYKRPSNRSRSRERHRRDNSPERDKKTAHWESPSETSERHRRPYNKSCSREAYQKHDRPELNKKMDYSNSSESSYTHKTENSERRDCKEVNKYSKSTIKGPIGSGDLNTLKDKLKQENKQKNKGEIKGGISDSTQNVSNQTETRKNIDQDSRKVCNNMPINLIESNNFHTTIRGDGYEEQPYGHKETNSSSCIKDNKDNQDSNIKITSEEDKTNKSDDLSAITLKQPFVKQSSNENQFDEPSESSKRESKLTVEASKLGTPCKVALFNEIFGQSSSTTATSSSTKSLFNNIKGLLANITSNEVITTATISPANCTEASDCNETTKAKDCRDNIIGNEMDQSSMRKQSKCKETKVNADGIANEIHSVQIPGLDLCNESVTKKHELKATDTFYNKSLTELFTKQHLKDLEEQKIVKESNEPENDMQDVSGNSLQMSAKLNPKDAEQQKEDKASKQTQSKEHSFLDNVLELEDVNRNIKQKISLQSVKDIEEPNQSKSHLVADNEHVKHKTCLDDINKNVKQNVLDNEQPKGEGVYIPIESNFLLVGNKSPELVKDKTSLEDINKNVEQKLILQTFTKQKFIDKKEPSRESEEGKLIRNLEPIKDTNYLEDVNKTKHNNTLQEFTKQHLEGNQDGKSIQIETNTPHLVPENVTNSLEFVKDKINVDIINQNTECIDKEKLSELKTISLIENVTEKEEQIGKTQNIVESNEEEVNPEEDESFYTKSKAEKTPSQLNEVQVNISNNKNDDLFVPSEENTLSNSSASPVKSSSLTITQENTETSTVSDVPQDKVNTAKIKNLDPVINKENSIKDCRLEEKKNENLCDKQHNNVKFSDTNNDLDTNQVPKACIAGNIPCEVENNERGKILNRVEATNPIDELYPLESFESAKENRTEIANSSDKSNPTNCDTPNAPLEKQRICEGITRSSKASDKPKHTDNDCNATQVQEAHIVGKALQVIKRNESFETLNRRKATEPAEEQYSFENQNSFNEMKTESANAGDKSNNTGTDLEKSLVQEANISESTLSDRTINESIEILSRIEGTKADDEQDLHENQKSFKGIIRNAAPNDKPQVQETFIFESIPSAVKNSERRETLNRVELMTSTDKQSPVENRDFSEEITGTDNGSAKTEGQEAHLPVSILQEFKNKESIVTDRVKVAIAPEAAQYPLENLNFPEEITKTTTTSDESNDTGNDSIKSQVQKQHISGKTSQDIINNESIETNMLESDKLYPLENQNCIEENTQIVSTSNEPMTTDCDSNKTSVKENAIRSNENKTTDPAVLIENQKMLLESGNKNESEAKEIENTSHNNASLIFEKHASPSLEPLKFDNLSHTINSLRETSLTVKPNDLNIEFSSLEVAAAESTMVSDGGKKSAGSESLELQAKLLTESAERIVPEMDKEEIIILNKKNSTILSDKNDRITVNENGSKVQYEDAPLTSSVAKEKMKDVLKGSKVMVIKTNDSLMNAKVTEGNVKDSRPTTILDPHTHSKNSKMDGTVKVKAAIDFTDQIQNQTSGVVQNQTLKESEVVLTSKQTQSLVDTSIQSSSKKFGQDLENAKKMLSSTGHETKRLELNLNASSLPQKPTDKADLDKNKACHAFNKPCTITSNSCNEKPTIPNTLDPISNKTGHIEVTKQIEVLKKNISNSDKGSGIIVNETITKQKSPGNIKSLPNLEIQKVECSATKTYQHENDFPKISPALPDSFNTSPTLPSISTSSPTPSNFSGIFSKKSSHLSPTEEDFHKLKKKSLHFSTRPREFIIPAASVLCNVDNLENATKLNKKLHWELLDNKNELTEIEDDTDIETTDEERHKLKGEIKQEQVTPQESPQQSPKDDQDEQSNPLYKADALRNSQEENYKATQNLPPKTHKSKQYKYKLSKTIKSKPVKSVTPSSFMDQKPFTIVLPKRQRGRPRKLENLLKATIKAKAGPRILKKRGRKPKKPIEFTESYDNNSTECAEPVIDAVSPKDKIANTLVSEGECALNVKENEELLAEPPIQIRNNCDVISHHEEEKSRQSSCELNDENKQQISLEDRNRTCFTRDQVISNESIIKDVVAGTNKDSTTDDQNFNFESKKIPKESNTKMSANKPRTLSLNSDNNCDDISTTSGDSENKLLIISDGGGPEEINEKQAEEVRTQEKVSSTKSKPLLERFEERKSSLNKKDKKYITLEEIGIKVRPFKGHLSTLRIPKVNKDADQTNAWKLEAYEELDKQQREEKLEQKIESEMNGSTTMVKAANKGFLATYRIPKIKRDAGHGKDILEKTETCGKTPKEERREKVDESYHETVNKNSESKGKLNNNCKVTEAKSIDKTKHIWRPEKTEKIKKTYKQQRDDECGNSAETGKRKLFNLETYNAVDQEDKIENAEGKLNGPKVNEKETPCNKGKPTKLRRKSLNLPRKMLAISSDEEEIKHLENVDAKNSLERNLLHTRKKASLHRRILDSSCDEDKEEKSTNKTHKTLKQRRKSMFVESTSFETDFHHTDESINDKKPTSNNLVKTTSGSETFDSEKNVDVLSSSENNHILKTTVESMDSVIMLSANDCKDTGIKNSLKIRRKSLFIESSSSETIALDNTRLSDVMLYNTAHMKLRNDSDNIFESANDSIKEPTIKNKNDDIELKPTKLLKSRRKSMHVEPNCASNLKNSSEDSNKTNEMLIKPKEKTLKIRRTSEVMKTTSINENPKKESSSIEPFDRENGLREEISNPNEPILEQNKIEEPVNTNEITNDLNSSTEQFPLKPRRKSSNHRRILDSSSDDNEPLMKKPLLNEPYVNEIKPPLASTELKTKSRKRRIVKVLSTSRDAINSSANSSLQSENLIQILSNSPSPYASPLHNHPIFNTEVSTQSHEFVASMPVTPNQQDDDKKFKEIDSKLHQIFQSPQYTSDYKANHNTTTDSNIMEMLSTSSSDGQGKNITAEVSLDPNRENDQSSANVDLNKPYLSPHTNTTDSIKLDMISTSLANAQGIDASPGETQPDTNQENNQSSVNINTTAVSHNCSEIKHLSLGSAEYRFEKVSDNVVNLFISRKRKRKRRN